MADVSPPAAIDRIDRAIARIETAVLKRDRQNAALVRRHAALRAEVAAAIVALDAVSAPEDAESDDA